ncbi:MAG: 7-carboxy-7-deazaguanine synthase QueE [Bacteroidetes bacterium]|nr:7-carboxy-7-deazaguanine synthase QueE [Bacteroidota bacterium]
MSSSSKYSTSLPLMEHFYTIQGEGFHQGKASYFIRLGGCDIGCVWCDVKDSWDAAKFNAIAVEEIVNEVVKRGAKICVVTGGEPMMHDLAPLTNALHTKGIKAHVETSGAYEISGNWDWICVSPKRFKLPVESSLLKASELKVVVFHKNDFRLAEEYQTKVTASCKLFLQPEWSKEKEMLPLMIDYVKANQQWEISLQIHKYMDIP